MGDQLLIDTVGHSAGLVLFGFLIVLFSRNKLAGRTRESRMNLVAAAVVFVWNLAELLLLAQPSVPGAVRDLAGDASLLCLNFLPAVLLHISLSGRLRPISLAGYGLSAVSIIFQYASGSTGSLEKSQASLLLLSLGFAMLSLFTWLWFEYQAKHASNFARPPSRIAFLSLFIFATSFIHFQHGHTSNVWMGEALWHHAAIPIALIVLLADYRFLLLDTFLRFIASAAWIALWLWAAAELEIQSHLWTIAEGSQFTRGLVLTGLCIAIYLLARSLRLLQSLLTTFAFGRPPLNRLLDELQHLSDTPEQVLLEESARLIAGSYECSRFAVVWSQRFAMQEPGHPALSGFPRGKTGYLPDWTVALIPLRFSKADGCQICLGARNGSRRFLSEEFSELRRVQAVLIERVERLRREELERLAQEAELNALQAQINPHFLFNALNTLYGTIGRDSPEARQLVLNLADMFRYRLQGSQKYVSLSEEIEIVRAYLEIETLRLGDRLVTEMDVDERLKGIPIPILTIQPLIENAVKHGASATGNIFVRLTVAASEEGARVSVEDEGPGFQLDNQSQGNGIALQNIHKRLNLCYGEDSGLRFQSGSRGAKVWFNIPGDIRS